MGKIYECVCSEWLEYGMKEVGIPKVCASV